MAITFTPGIADQTLEQKAAEYNSLLDQGFTDAQIKAAADAAFGTQSASDWSALTSFATQALPPTLSQVANTSGVGSQGIGLNFSGQSLAPDYGASMSTAGMTVEDLYRSYAGRGSDPEGLAYWTREFGDTIDPNEIGVFQAAVAEARARGTEPAAGALTQAAPAITFTPGLAGQTLEQKAAEYNSLRSQGFTDDQIRAAADSTFGTQSASDWSALTSLANQGGLNQATQAADTSGLGSQSIGAAGAVESGAEDGTNAWNYETFYEGMSKGSSDTGYLSSLLDPLAAQAPVLASNARNIFNEIINQQTVTGDAWASGRLGSKESAALDYALRLAEAGISSLSDIKKENYIEVDGEGGERNATRLVNSKTGEVIGYDGAFTHSSGGGNRLGYALEVTDNGIVVPYTVPRSSGWVEFREGTLKPALSLFGPFIPGAAPFIAAGNAINAANKGDWGSAIASALTAAPGFGSALQFSQETIASLNNAKTAGQVLNAIDKGNPVALVNALAQTSVGNDLMQRDMGGGISLGDVVNSAKVAQLASAGNYTEALATVADITGSSNVRVAASALNLAEAISTGEPFRIINAVGQLDRTIKSTDQADGGITNRVYDDTIVQAGADAFIRAKEAGASDEDAMAAANAVTETGVIINAIPDAGPSNAVSVTYGEGGVDTNFGDLQGAIESNAMSDAIRADKLDLISNLPKFSDAYSQARTLLGPNQTFTWRGKEYSTATAQERPDLSAPRVQAATDESAAETARLAAQNRALVTGNAPDQSAAETARLRNLNTSLDLANAATRAADAKAAITSVFGEGLASDLVVQGLSNLQQAFGQTFDFLGGVGASTGLAGSDNALTNVGQSLGRTGEAMQLQAVTNAGQNVIDAVDKAKGFGNKVVAGAKAIIENPLSANYAVIELIQEGMPIALAARLYKTAGMFTALGVDVGLNAMESGGAARNEAYRESIARGDSEDQANENADRKFWIASTVTALTGAAVDTAVINKITKAMDKVATKPVTTGGKEGGAEALEVVATEVLDVLASGKTLTPGIVDDIFTKAVVEGFVGGKTASAVDTTTGAGNVVTDIVDTGKATTGADAVATNISNNINAAINSGDIQNVGPVITESVSSSLNSGADASVVVNSAITSGLSGDADPDVVIGNTVTSAINSGADASVVINSSVTSAINSGASVNTTVGSAITSAVTAGADVGVAINSTVGAAITSGANTIQAVSSSVAAAINSGADASVVVDSAITAAADSGASVDAAIGSAVSSAVNAGADVNTVVQAATNAATTTGSDVSISSDANTVTVSNATTNTNTTVDTNTGITTTVDNNSGITTVVDGNTTTVVDANTTSQTKVEGNIETSVVADSNTNTNTQTVVDANTNTTTSTTVNANTNTTTQTTIDANTQTTVLTDVNANIQTTVTVNIETGEVTNVKETEVPKDWTQPVIQTPSVSTPPASTSVSTEEDPAKRAARLNLPQRGGVTGGGGFGLPSTIDVEPASLRSRETQKAIDPLARVMEAQQELEKTAMMNQIDPRLLSVMQQRMQPDQPNQAQQFESDIGALARLLGGKTDTPANEGRYYSYGSEDSIDDILMGMAANYAAGGYVEPLKASGGSMALPLLAKSGGALDKYNGREDFKGGKHVAGEGDGQSDDIPAWLADGEFVFPADVVSALGNGSTKAGTDKLYEMMHNIRDRARSNGPKDLPPPALKSPLDYLKSSKRSTK